MANVDMVMTPGGIYILNLVSQNVGRSGPSDIKLNKYSLKCLEVKCTVTDVAFVEQLKPTFSY